MIAVPGLGGRIWGFSSLAGADSTIQGSAASTVKKNAPSMRTTRSRSERGSIGEKLVAGCGRREEIRPSGSPLEPDHSVLMLERRAALLIGAGLGAAIWLISPLLTGRREPWDVEGAYYPAMLLGTGVLGGALAPSQWRKVALGVFGGQVVVLLVGVIAEPGSGGLWPLGILFLAVYSVLALLGAGFGASVRRFTGRGKDRGSTR